MIFRQAWRLPLLPENKNGWSLPSPNKPAFFYFSKKKLLVVVVLYLFCCCCKIVYILLLGLLWPRPNVAQHKIPKQVWCIWYTRNTHGARMDWIAPCCCATHELLILTWHSWRWRISMSWLEWSSYFFFCWTLVRERDISHAPNISRQNANIHIYLSDIERKLTHSVCEYRPWIACPV